MQANAPWAGMGDGGQGNALSAPFGHALHFSKDDVDGTLKLEGGALLGIGLMNSGCQSSTKPRWAAALALFSQGGADEPAVKAGDPMRTPRLRLGARHR